MLTNFIVEGNKVELRPLERLSEKKTEGESKLYTSQVYHILTEDSLEIIMPVEDTKLILLPVDSEFDLVFYGADSLYQCFARIIDRYKSSNMYLLRVELISNLRRYQRREYYRFSCNLDMCARNLVEEELQAIEKNMVYELTPGIPLKQSVIVDISGGGLRFLSSQRYEEGSLIYCNYQLIKEPEIPVEEEKEPDDFDEWDIFDEYEKVEEIVKQPDKEEQKKYEVIGKVLAVKEVEDSPGTYEHRVQYYGIDINTREAIIKYIFDKERKSRQKEVYCQEEA